MTQCPVSGLSVTEKEHWSFENRQGNYTRKYSLIGNDIIHVQELASQGIIPDHLYSADFTSLIGEENLTGKPVFIMIDCEPIIDLKFSYKREFTNLVTAQESDLRLIVLYNIKPSVRLQLEMLQSLATEKLPVMLCESYKEAVTSILDFKSGNVSSTKPDAGTDKAFRNAFLAEVSRILMLRQFSQLEIFPPENHASYPYFEILDMMRRDLQALEEEHQQSIERIEQEFRVLLASKNSLLDEQIEVCKRSEQRFKAEESALLSRIAAQEIEATRISTANAEKNAALRTLCEMIEKINIDPAAMEKISAQCATLFETSDQAAMINTELTETDSVFLSKLQKKHPNLNQRELRISLMIKLDYHSRDIARSLGLSTRGIESIRYRLHKKIGLDKHNSLKTYLTNLATESL
ncbi:MAG: helix-turn-helix transcriptional regulator [Chlorobaculum sp.]